MHAGNRNHDGFSDRLRIMKDAGVPPLRRAPDRDGGNFSHLRVDRVEQPREVADDSANQQALKPFVTSQNEIKRQHPLSSTAPGNPGAGRLVGIASAEQAGEQGNKGGANQGNTAASHELFYPQLGVKLCSMAGGGVSKNIWSFYRTVPDGTGQAVTCSTSGMGLRLK